jgi:PAS domain S-box-containing protein
MSEPGSLSEPVMQQALLLELWDQAPALVFVADAERRYLAVNATACEVLGYSREELLRLRVTDVAVADDADGLYDEMVQIGRQAGRTRIRGKDGSMHAFNYSARECTIAGLTYYISVGFVAPRTK